jgi:hypothetical protein
MTRDARRECQTSTSVEFPVYGTRGGKKEEELVGPDEWMNGLLHG